MLKRHEVDWVKHLSEQGLSRRAIALKTGFARDTVRKILDGRRPDYEALRLAREQEEEPLFSGPIERCGTCGGKVYMPCVACHVRKFRDARLTEPVTAADIRSQPMTTAAAAALRRRRRTPDHFSRQRRDDSNPRRRCA